MDPGFRTLIRASDEDAFATLFRTGSTAVYNYCFRLSGDWSVAEDGVSLVYLEAWRLREKVDPEGASLLPWLLGIATNVMHRRQRVTRRHNALLQRLPMPQAVPDFAGELVDRMEDEQHLAAVAQVLQQLPRADREVLALCVWGQLDYAAAAEALRVPVGTIRSRLSRARKRLESLAAKNRNGREPGSGRWQLIADRTPAARS